MQPHQLVKETNIQPILEKLPICKYYVERKKRFCKFQVAKDSEYCKLHNSWLNMQDRMLCPYENGIYILTSAFQKHLKVCPKYLQKKKEQKQQWFTKNINAIKNQTLNQQSTKQTLNQQELKVFIPKLLSKFFQVFSKQPNGAWYYIDLSQQSFQTVSTDKHQMQCDLILNLISKYQLLSLKNIYVEFGAGKGLLSSTIAKKFKNQNCKNILLEMEPRRNKADFHHKENPFFQRFKSNVGDFDLGKIRNIMIQHLKNKKQKSYTQQQIKQFEEELSQCRLVGVCKHMCGMATDLSISALKNASKYIQIVGTVLATCCHHRCSYQTFQNIKYFQSLGFNSHEISLIFKLTTWGVMRSKQPKWVPELNQQNFIQKFKKQQGNSYSQNQRQIIGKACKRLIDRARGDILKELNLKVDFVKYCDYDTTAENFVLICY